MKRAFYLFLALLFISSLQADQCRDETYNPCCPSLSDFDCNMPCDNEPCYDWVGVNGGFVKLLYWNMYGDGLNWARKLVATDSPVGSTGILNDTTQTAYKHVFDYRPGFRIGFNHQFPCFINDMNLFWTYYWNSNSQSVSALPGSGTITRFFSPYLEALPLSEFDTVTNQTFSSKMSFRLNRVDFTIGQNVEACHGFSINYYGGPVYWGTQEDLFISSFYTTSTNPLYFSTFKKIDTSYYGGGAEVGLRLHWNFCNNFVLSANSNIGGTIGKYNLNGTTFITSDAPFEGLIPPLTNITSNIGESLSYWTGRVAASLGLTLRYSQCIGNRWVVYSSLGWEYHNYFDQTAFQIQSSANLAKENDNEPFTQASANLIMQGLTFTIGTTF